MTPPQAALFSETINALPSVQAAALHLAVEAVTSSSSIRELAQSLYSSDPRNFAASVRSPAPLRRPVKKTLKAPHKPDQPPRSSQLTTTQELPEISLNPKDTRSASANVEYTVWYGTNRKPLDPKDLGRGYSPERDSSVHLGTCKVFVPDSHKIGSTGSSWLVRVLKGVDDRLKITSISESAADVFWADVTNHLQAAQLSERDVVIFIHGYNVSFEDAAIRAAQIGVDLAVPGVMAFFSWPSKGTLRGYLEDGATIEASENFIAQFMIDFTKRSGASKVHIIAHSMGNRGVLRAVNRIADKAAKLSRKPFDQIILAAADVDAGSFRMLCDAYSKVSSRTTMYVSSRDRAVEAAHWLYDFPRAGLVPPVTVLRNIDTINVTNVDLTTLGHGYIAEAREVLSDMHSLLVNGSPPDSRFGLRKLLTINGEAYWLIGE
jgi:esterase/lipase superfamily enzyme